MLKGMKYKAAFIGLIIVFAVILVLPTIGSKQMEIILKPNVTAEEISAIEDRFKAKNFQVDKIEGMIVVEGSGINDAVMNEARILAGVKNAKILPHWAEKALLAKQVNLGLDLQVGMSLTMMADFKKIEERRSRELGDTEREEIFNKSVENIEKTLNKKLNDDEKEALKKQIDEIIKIAFEKLQDSAIAEITEAERLQATQKAFEKIEKAIKKPVSAIDKKDIIKITFEEADKKLKEKLSESDKNDITQQALELLRNRVDKFGVSEPSIRPRGNEAIEIQLPGVKDPKSVKAALGKTGRVEYRLVDDEYSVKAEAWLNKYSQTKELPESYEELSDIVKQISKEIKLPRSLELLFLFKRRADTKKLYPSNAVVLKREISLAGDDINKAWVGRDEFGGLSVHFKTTPEGAAKFASVTSEKNKGKKLAVIIDDKVRSMPRINEQIPTGNASITGDFTSEEVNALARIIKEGALPVNLEIIEERTVGPSLGQDSIDLGIRAVVIGFLGVMFFMIIYYKLAGLISVFGLFLNMIFMLALLSWLGFTVTLPGIAGFILTVGMAVDANVIIYERVKEELRGGKSVRMAITNGFDRAFWTIFDANITTLIAAFILSQYGTGPVKGFAITLTVGIVSSMFVALYITRFTYEVISSNKNIKKLSI